MRIYVAETVPESRPAGPANDGGPPAGCFGAPFGAFLVSVIPRVRTLYFVSALCVVQFVWTLQQVAAGPDEWALVAGGLSVAVVGFYWMYRVGKKRAA